MFKKIFIVCALTLLSACMNTQVKFSEYVPEKPTYSKFYNYRGNDVEPIKICGSLENIAMVEEDENFLSFLVRVILWDAWQPTYVNVYCKQDPSQINKYQQYHNYQQYNHYQ
ncbi:MAG: hypothetical protein MJ250_06410 [Alphaproteobacteria bacterium]|nr:hypothetical protein [Alphaproteobacteria bacterium]